MYHHSRSTLSFGSRLQEVAYLTIVIRAWDIITCYCLSVNTTTYISIPASGNITIDIHRSNATDYNISPWVIRNIFTSYTDREFAVSGSYCDAVIIVGINHHDHVSWYSDSTFVIHIHDITRVSIFWFCSRQHRFPVIIGNPTRQLIICGGVGYINTHAFVPIHWTYGIACYRISSRHPGIDRQIGEDTKVRSDLDLGEAHGIKTKKGDNHKRETFHFIFSLVFVDKL